jgi:hypothetical protein
MKKCILPFISCFIMVFMGLTTGICQTITNGTFDGTTNGWTGCTASPEVACTESCFGGSSSTNYVAEVDAGTTLCQNVSLGAGSHTLYLDLGRRTSTGPGGKAAPSPMVVKVCIGATAGTGFCTTFSSSTANGTPLNLSAVSFTFSGSCSPCILSIAQDASSVGGDGGYGMIVDNISFGVPTPVTLLNFTAAKNESEVDISWQTATEINNNYFIVEKSKNGIDFINVGIVEGAGNSQSKLSYQITDHSPYNGISYYRLKQVDYDGTVSYSKIVAVNFNGNKNITLYPNPSTGIFNIQGLNAETEISVQNPLGQVVLIKKDFSGSSEIDLSSQPSGVYFIKVNNGDTSASTKIILHR